MHVHPTGVDGPAFFHIREDIPAPNAVPLGGLPHPFPTRRRPNPVEGNLEGNTAFSAAPPCCSPPTDGVHRSVDREDIVSVVRTLPRLPLKFSMSPFAPSPIPCRVSAAARSSLPAALLAWCAVLVLLIAGCDRQENRYAGTWRDEIHFLHLEANGLGEGNLWRSPGTRSCTWVNRHDRIVVTFGEHPRTRTVEAQLLADDSLSVRSGTQRWEFHRSKILPDNAEPDDTENTLPPAEDADKRLGELNERGFFPPRS